MVVDGDYLWVGGSFNTTNEAGEILGSVAAWDNIQRNLPTNISNKKINK
jgi:hypothetical protein